MVSSLKCEIQNLPENPSFLTEFSVDTFDGSLIKVNVSTRIGLSLRLVNETV